MTSEKPGLIVEPVPPKEEDPTLPRVEGPMFQYNHTTNMFWIGIPVNKTEPFIAFAVLDSMKLNYLQAFNSWAAEAKSKIVTPGVLNRAREMFLRKTGRA